MECYEGAKMIKTFRGLLADGAQDQIRLSTKHGKVGYKIVKFQIIGYNPGNKDQESIVKIFKIKQSSITGTVDFNDGNMLAAAYWAIYATANTEGVGGPIIFEQEVFNQDIFVTHKDNNTGESCNYYLELEVMNLSDNEATVSTLMDIRASS